jgi:hygromycin-B 7''-O-kinase
MTHLTQPLSDRPLAPLEQLDGYVRHFMDLQLWEPYVRWVCAKNALPCWQVRGGLAGTCPTFIVDERCVVKFYGRLFDGGRAFEVEREAARLVSQVEEIPAATLLASGQLFLQGESWLWPYLVFAFIPGASIGEASAAITAEERMKIGTEMGRIVRRLHQIALDDSPLFHPTWSEYLDFLKAQRVDCADRPQEWGSMSQRLIDQIDAYLMPADEWIEADSRPHLIHADLTRDHLLGQVKQGRWTTGGLIDFGDAMVGDLAYELAALHLDLFDADQQMLKRFLDAYRDCRNDDWFVRKAMSAALLHQFDVIGPLLQRQPALMDAGSLKELSERLWR